MGLFAGPVMLLWRGNAGSGDGRSLFRKQTREQQKYHQGQEAITQQPQSAHAFMPSGRLSDSVSDFFAVVVV